MEASCGCVEAELCSALQGHPRYDQVAFIKRGAFSAVVLAKDKVNGEQVALKFIPRSSAAKQEGMAEAEILNHMRLLHPHIISLQEVFLTEEYLVLVLEYAPGGDLAGRIPSGRGLPEDQVRWLFMQVLFALDYCHRVGVASRDIKLENLLIKATEPLPILKLADFGLSTRTEGPGLACSHDVCGTPMYFPPELINTITGQAYDAQKADMWSCGVLLYMMLTGRCPFQRSGDAQLGELKERARVLLQRIQDVDYIMPPGLSPSCCDLLRHLLVADPSQRLSAQQALQHPWCQACLEVGVLLQCNDLFVAKTLNNPPPRQLLCEVREILKDATMMPTTPCKKHPRVATANGSSSGSAGGLEATAWRSEMDSM